MGVSFGGMVAQEIALRHPALAVARLPASAWQAGRGDTGRDGRRDALTRVLYLTHMQAQLFKGATVPMVLQVFAVRPPSLVINLMESGFYPVSYEKDIDQMGLSEQERADCHFEAPATVYSTTPASNSPPWWVEPCEAAQLCSLVSSSHKASAC